MVDYYALLEAVRQGEQKSFTVTVQEFPAFQHVWQGYPYQNQIRGEASRGGTIEYMQQKER